ncbi:hypothetical protein OF83DRAFT_254745 [Amylostereum chailletii]|nr:hypothetical protein OF83DRAFT_254745 [Amylostereum chailletii]
MSSTSDDDPLAFVDKFGGRIALLAPGVLSALVQAIQTGIILSQFMHFIDRWDKEHRIMRSLVTWVVLAAMFQSVTAFHTWWNTYVVNFGLFDKMFVIDWAQRAQFVVNLLMSTPVQSFLLWRCWLILGRNLFIIIPLGIILLGCVAASIVVTVESFVKSSGVAFTENVNPAVVIALTLPAILDILLTGILLLFLSRSRSDVYTRRTRQVMRRLMFTVWEAAVPPCVVAFVSMIIYVATPRNFPWGVMLQTILGKLYVMSLLITLNNRTEISSVFAQNRTHFPTAASSMNIEWNGGLPADVTHDIAPQIRLSINTRRSSGQEHLALDSPTSRIALDDLSSADHKTRASPPPYRVEAG